LHSKLGDAEVAQPGTARAWSSLFLFSEEKRKMSGEKEKRGWIAMQSIIKK